MKMKSISDDGQDIYIGYYNGKIICMHPEKAIVQMYLKLNRHLSKDEYDIKRKFISETDLCLSYDDYLMYDYHGLYIPNVDSVIIDKDCATMDAELDSTLVQLKQLLLLISHLKKTDEEIKKIIETIKILQSYKSKKKYNKLYKENILSHPILYCNIKEYSRYINQFNELRTMSTNYKDAWLNDNYH